MSIKRRIAAATLALSLALAGLLGVDASHGDVPAETTEQAGATWSFTGWPGKGGSGTNGATWS